MTKQRPMGRCFVDTLSTITNPTSPTIRES